MWRNSLESVSNLYKEAMVSIAVRNVRATPVAAIQDKGNEGATNDSEHFSSV